MIPDLLENGEPLVEIKPIANKLYIEPQYFLKGIPDSLSKLYLRREAASKLFKALQLLPETMSFILYDGFRPLQVQSFLYNDIKNKIRLKHPHWTAEQLELETLKYVAFPSTENSSPSPHLTGGAIDLTLGDEQGRPLDLGTAFDATEEKSATAYFEKHRSENEAAHINRRILFHCMTQAGFQNYEEEWWHYDYGNRAWARKLYKDQCMYGPIIATIEQNELKEYQFR
ncbi:M15 family metallopeptidase [Solibacillus sp. A46]|uniref:D-alanyl-D-alanine dipeptidase n=1 Tax=Solibacillus faecavium TaxID=2762221 RepID=A0ABR8XZ33_9BACL|nr:M15 family metallopeptidase [Solibacillus faecavium]MBD8037198.1 M15 family metallopeptidase [Solibacillus faecavium]